MKKIGIIIGQAPPKGIIERPFGRTRLYQWFETIGFSKEQMAELFDFGSLVAEFPGSGKAGHLVPQPDKIAEYRPTLIAHINATENKILIPVGKMAIQEIMNIEPKLEEVVGEKFIMRPFETCAETTIIPLPHPSGVSTWHYKPENKKRLDDALELIRQTII